MITNFSIFKNKKEKETQPDYKMSAKVIRDNKEEFADIGAVFLKEAVNGTKFFSCAMAKDYTTQDGTVRQGYCIVPNDEYNKMKKVYEDYLIKQRNPTYPTPTDLDIDLDKMEAIMNGEIKPENSGITQEDIDNIPF